MSSRELQSCRAVIFDMDGVLYRGSAPLPGAVELFAALELRSIPYRLATNNSTMTPAQYVQKLRGMGLTVSPEMIVTSGTATRDYLMGTAPAGAGIFVIGEPALFDQLFHNTGLRPLQYLEETPSAVVVGLDREFTYEKLYKANEAIRAGARYVATNADVTLPTEHGLVPGCGSIIAAVAAATGVQPEIVGKPETVMMETCASDMGVPLEQTLIIGDRLDTDIVSGQRAGGVTALVLTGVSTREDLAEFPIKPDFVMTDLNAVLAALNTPSA